MSNRQLTFTEDGVTITVHCRTGMDDLDQDILIAILVDYALSANNVLYNRVRNVARIITQTDSVTGDLGFTLPTALAAPEDIKAAYAALMARPGGLVKAWSRALDQVDKAPLSEAGSTADPKDSESTSSGSESGSPTATATSPARRVKSPT